MNQSDGPNSGVLSDPSSPEQEHAKPAHSGRSARMARVVFSFPVMCMFLLVPVLFGFSVRNIAEPDIWWHLRNGEQIVEHHHIPDTDTYSFGASGSAWLDHEWLSEVPYFLAFRAAGLHGLFALYFVLVVLIYSGVFYASCYLGADCKSAALTTLLAILLGVVSIGPRMLLFGWLCMAVLLLVLAQSRSAGHRLWLLPPLFALWVNLHGSWLFGIIVLVITIAGGVVEGQWGSVVSRRWTPAELKRWLLVLACCLGALFVNPFGYRLPLYPFDLLFRQPSNLKYIQEWQSVDFGTGGGKVVLILIFLLFSVVLFSKRSWQLSEVLLVAFALWTGLSHARMMFFMALIIPPLLAMRLTLFPPYDPDIDKPWLNGMIMAGLTVAMAFYWPSTQKLQSSVDSQFPTAALSYMRQHKIQGRIFNADWWGGYMEWNLRELKPFTDGRTDIFVYNGSFDDHVAAGQIQRPFEILDKYGIEYALLEKKRPLSYLLEHSQQWHPLYSDDVAILFQRNVPLSKAASSSH